VKRLSLPLLIAATAFGASLTTTLAMHRFISPDRWEYSTIARNIVDGKGANYPWLGTDYYFYGSALYPRLMAAVFRLTGGSEPAVLILQMALFAGLCVVIYYIALQWFGGAVAASGALLAALHPGSLVFVGRLHDEILDALLITVTFVVLLRMRPATRLSVALAVGLVAGLAAATRGTVVIFCLLWAFWFVVRERRQLQAALRVVTVIAVGGLAMLAPFLVDGFRRYGELIPLRTDNGVNFWVGNHHNASGTSYTLNDPPLAEMATRPVSLVAGIAGMNEVEQSRAFNDAAIEFIKSHPGEFVRLFFKKLVYFWWFSPRSGLLYPALWTLFYKPYYSVALIFSVIGIAAAWRSPRPATRAGAQAFVLLAASVSAAQALFFVDGRHRWAVEPLLLVFTALGVATVLRACIPSQVPDIDA
jgi:4-amino-4-deoxy-L-arabinose transferase-like glycosyltransferase